MDSSNYNRLLYKLDMLISSEKSELVSPTSPPSGVGRPPASGLFITQDMDVESLSQDELVLAHVLLHKFNLTGNKWLKKPVIKELHDRIAVLIPHENYDRLDEK